MSEWQPIETLPDDGQPVELLMSGGTTCIAPARKPQPPSKADKLKLIKEGVWPDHRRFTPTHWRPSSWDQARPPTSAGS